MDAFELSAALVSLAALFSFLNYHFFRLPTTIGLMLFALLTSLVIIVAGSFFPNFETRSPLQSLRSILMKPYFNVCSASCCSPVHYISTSMN